MALFGAIICILILWVMKKLYGGATTEQIQKANRKEIFQDLPGYRYQEEYLYGCELFHKYRMEGRPLFDACRDATLDAKEWIYNRGMIPGGVDSREEWKKMHDLIYSSWYQHETEYLSDPPKKEPKHVFSWKDADNRAATDKNVYRWLTRDRRKYEHNQTSVEAYDEAIDRWYDRLTKQAEKDGLPPITYEQLRVMDSPDEPIPDIEELHSVYKTQYTEKMNKRCYGIRVAK